MKLLKVGSSPSCDIVINSGYVSNYHADVTVLDSGEILIEDKNSKNGTYIGINKIKLQPNQEVQVHRGDRVLLGNEPLDWSKVPQPTKITGAKRIINIGSNQRNDVVVPGSAVSRYHATLFINKDGHPMLVDNKSTNGTKVNGQRLQPDRPVRVKAGDNIIVGEEDVTSQLEPFIPKKKTGKIIMSIAAAVCLIGIIGGGIYFFLNKKGSGIIPDSAVVMVRNVYHYEMEPTDNPYKIPFKYVSKPYVALGTGFFIDEDGRIGTCRHVTAPWHEEYQELDMFTGLKINQELAQAWDSYVREELPKTLVTYDDLKKLSSTELGISILEVTENMRGNRINNINNILEQLRTTAPKITGISDQVSVAYSNRHYTSFDEFQPAVIVGDSGDKDKDVAIIQLNTGETPEKVLKAGIFNIENCYMDKPAIQAEELEFKGFPDGIARTWDEHFQSSTNVPTTYHGKVSRVTSPFLFEIQASTTHGASGSPVYYGDQLYGVANGAHAANDDVIVTPARWLKELYDQKVAPYKD